MKTYLVLIATSLIFSSFVLSKDKWEFKYTTNGSSFAQILNSYQDKLLSVETRDVYYADTVDQYFKQNNVILRIRTKKGKIESTVKLRGLTEKKFNRLSKLKFSKKYKYKCEQDKIIYHMVKRSCSLSRKYSRQAVLKAQDFFDKTQVEYLSKDYEIYAKHPLDAAYIIGPIKSEVHEYQFKDMSLDLTHWYLKGTALHLYEISTKDSESALEDLIVRDHIIQGPRTTKTTWAYKHLTH